VRWGQRFLAKETVSGNKSKFRGFQEVIDTIALFRYSPARLVTTIVPSPVWKYPMRNLPFFGSRCDLFDGTLSHAKKETLFDEREKLLLREYKRDAGTGPTVGIPRALMVHDYAPLLIGFLNELDAKVILSGKTNKEIMEQSAELSYSDSCFPLKLLYGHVAALNKVDYILSRVLSIRYKRRRGEPEITLVLSSRHPLS